MLSPAEGEAMSRSLALSAGFLVGVCVFAWLAGPVVEARFGAEALLVAYGAVAAGTAGTTYVAIRRVEGYLTRPARGGTDRAGGDATSAGETGESSGATAAVGLEDLDVEREVKQLKAERSRPAGED
jgi:hypothetical protein